MTVVAALHPRYDEDGGSRGAAQECRPRCKPWVSKTEMDKPLWGERTRSHTSGNILVHLMDIRPQLADAALVYLAEREGIDTIFTLDQRDFSVYRSGRRRPFRILPEL